MSDQSAPPVRAGSKESEDVVPLETEGHAPAFTSFVEQFNGQQLASYMTSMLVHMTLLLVLALIAFAPQVEQPPRELSLDPHQEFVEADDEPMELLDAEIKVPSVEPDEPPPPELPDVAAANVQDPLLEPSEILADVTTPVFDRPTGMAPALAAIGGATNPYDRKPGAPATSLGDGDGRPTEISESAVEAALRWLAVHQNNDGSWSFDHTPGGRCSGFANPGDKKSRMGATGLALLPFLGAGYTHQDDKYKDVVRQGIKFLVGNMIVHNNAGRLFEANGANHEHMYCHGMAACALAEAFGMTNDYSLQAPAQLAVNYIVQAQDPESGGWIYTPRAGGDTSVVGWQVMALKSAILSHLNVPGSIKPLANKWLDSVQSELPDVNYGIGSRYGYRRPGDRNGQSGACTAIGLICRNYLGAAKDDPGIRQGVEWLAARRPSKDDMYYNYYGSMVMFQNDGRDGELWKAWDRAMKELLVGTQVKAGGDRGSWHFAGNQGNTGGRLYNTALAAMTLEVYYRYLPIYQQKNIEEPFPLE